MTPKTREAIDERLRWIADVLEDAEHRGAEAIAEAIHNLDDQDLPGLLFMLLSSYSADVQRVKQLMREKYEDFGGWAETG